MSARFRAEDRSAPHTNAESSPFFVTAYFRIPGLDDKWDRAFGEDTDGGFIRQDWDDEAERRALDFWLSGASSKAADYEASSSPVRMRPTSSPPSQESATPRPSH